MILLKLEGMGDTPKDLESEGFPNLKCLYVEECRGIEYLVITKRDRMPFNVFPMVEILGLQHMPDLR